MTIHYGVKPGLRETKGGEMQKSRMTPEQLDNTVDALKAKTGELREQYNLAYGSRVSFEHPHIGGQGEVEEAKFHLRPTELSQMIGDIIAGLSAECDCGRDVGLLLEKCVSEMDIRRAILEWLREH